VFSHLDVKLSHIVPKFSFCGEYIQIFRFYSYFSFISTLVARKVISINSLNRGGCIEGHALVRGKCKNHIKLVLKILQKEIIW